MRHSNTEKGGSAWKGKSNTFVLKGRIASKVGQVPKTYKDAPKRRPKMFQATICSPPAAKANGVLNSLINYGIEDGG